MIVTYQEHGHMWKSPASLEHIIRTRAPAAHRSGRVQETEELWQLYRQYCQHITQHTVQAHA